MAYCIANARGIRRRRGLEKMAGQYYGQTLATVTLTLTCSATYKINKNEDTNFRSHLSLKKQTAWHCVQGDRHTAIIYMYCTSTTQIKDGGHTGLRLRAYSVL